jgi:hypothetical protein
VWVCVIALLCGHASSLNVRAQMINTELSGVASSLSPLGTQTVVCAQYNVLVGYPCALFVFDVFGQ